MLTYYVLSRNAQTAEPAGVFVIDPARGHALMWDHRRRSWVYNPGLVTRFLDDYRNLDRYREVDRVAADQVALAVTGGQFLPDAETIEGIFEQAAGE
ncbi:hypothetical protein [Micromonospora antibiotica]|uniref:Uncharacterized protein n=1 Tax=Micromonospora antibiotica TaxID=2807623 RepID=A0ABS3VGR5_9ACTN|nr:hypothetical protein [Micromonospora antibiotica]MBO4164798.1 hypothetical protein [Micromonospora antibiotica]